jgi:protein-tyrosine phosphatase
MHAGDMPDSRSVEIARRKGLDITQQRSRKIRSIDLQEFDLVFCMDNHNLRDVLGMCISEEEKAKVKMIMNEVEPDRNVSVPDPYYGGVSGFDNVYTMLEVACEKIVENYK